MFWKKVYCPNDLLECLVRMVGRRCLALCDHPGLGAKPPTLSHRMFGSNGFRKSAPSQNCRLVVDSYELKRYVDDCLGELTL